MNKKKKILLLSDDARSFSGVGVMSKEIILQTVDQIDWVQLGAIPVHPEAGKIFDLSKSVADETGVTDAYVKIYANSGYGDQQVLRELLELERPDAIMHFTDPRFWGWLYAMEHEIRRQIPIIYYTIWDNTPAPKYNEPYYRSCDMLNCISKQTYALVKSIVPDYEPWQVNYIPHGINSDKFYPISETSESYNKFIEYRKKIVPEGVDFIVFYNARNLIRKRTMDTIVAFAAFYNGLKVEERSRCMMLLHTAPVDEHGTDLIKFIGDNYKGLPIYFTPTRAVTTEELNYLYNMASVTINLASSEGFGLGTAESVMAGTPIIVNVTGGLQDQCGFMKLTLLFGYANKMGCNSDGMEYSYLTEDDYARLNDIKSINPDGEDSVPITVINNPLTPVGGPTNAEGYFDTHGLWAFPVYPASRTLQGSIATPYIVDDVPSIKYAATMLKTIFDIDIDERKSYGLEGREYFMSDESGLSAKVMGDRFKRSFKTLFERWTPKPNYTITTI